MKTLLLAFRLLLAIGEARAVDVSVDSTRADVKNEIIDLAQNRLFMMSTGRTMPARTFSAADFEIFLLQVGYAPTDFVHFNFSYIFPLLGRSTYWSLGQRYKC